MEDKDNEFSLDIEDLDGYIPEGGFDLEEILKEDFSTGNTPEPDVPRSAAPADLPEPEPEPEPAASFADVKRPDAIKRGKAKKEEEPAPVEEPRREREPSRVPNIPTRALVLLAAVTLAAVMVCVAVRFRLTGAAWAILAVGGIAMACVPMVVSSLDILREKDRIPAPLLMLLAVVILSASGGIIEALVTAILFDLGTAAMAAFFRHELSLMASRLEAKGRDLDKPLAQRLEALMREISYRRLTPVVRQRALERLVVFGVLAVTFVTAVIVPLADGMSFAKWAGRGAALLAVCIFTGEAQVLMTYLNAAASASGEGIYFSGSAAISAATEVTSVLFNKSGTLTDGRYKVVNVDPVRLSREQVLYLAVCAGAWSQHPLAAAIRSYAGVRPDLDHISLHTEREGYGSLIRMDDGHVVAVGNIDLMEELGVRGDMYIPGDTCVFVAVGKTCVGRIDLADELKPDAVTVVHELRGLRVANVALMTGDNALNATNTGRRVGIAEVYSDCRPKDKMERLQYILDSQEKDDRLMLVSSAGRDKELLEMANLSVTLGMGQDVTDTFPDIVITSGKLADLTRALRISRRVRTDLTASFAAASALRIACVVMALTGVLGLWGVTALMLATGLVTFLLSFVSEK